MLMIKKHGKIKIMSLVSTLSLLLLVVLGLVYYTYTSQDTHAISDDSQTFLALTELERDIFAQNHLIGWDPTDCVRRGGGLINGACGGEITATDMEGRLRQVLEYYGVAAMNLQIEYGIPWEIPFVHMWAESSMGTNDDDIAAGVAACGYYDWMGYRYADNSLYGLTVEEMGDCVVTHTNGGPASQYENIADMIGAFATDYLRNGSYDAAFAYATQDNFDLEQFLRTETDGIYCAAGCGDHYVRVLHTILPIIREVATANGWPTSEELMKEKNIQKGGNWPVNGDVKTQMNVAPHSLHLSCDGSTGSTATSSTSSTSSSDISGDQITWIGDSYSVMSNTQISSKFPGVDFGSGTVNTSTSYIQGSKWAYNSTPDSSNPHCLTILEDIISQNNLRPYLVLACGTNGGWSDEAISKLDSLISGQDVQVVLTTSKTANVSDTYYDDSNNRLKTYASAHDNVTVADWAAVYDESYFSSGDTIHPTSPGGFEKWIEVIANALSGASSGGGCTTFEGQYPQYKQSRDYSCGHTSMAMLATVAAGQDITEEDIVDLVGERAYPDTRGSGMVNLDKKVGEKYGFEVETVSVDEGDVNDVYNKMKQYLNDGYMLHFSGAGSLPFSGGGHYVGIFDIDSNDNVMVADSAHGNQQYNLMDVITAGYYGDAFSAIKGSGGGGTCSNLCRNTSSRAISGGLSESEAQTLADYYNGPEVNAASLILNTKDNCVSLVGWFLESVGGLSRPANGYGNGKYVVSTLQGEGFETGDDPRPFAVFVAESTRHPELGHTGIVLSVDGDQVTVMEASLEGTGGAHINTYSTSYFTISPAFAYTDGKISMTKLNNILGN